MSKSKFEVYFTTILFFLFLSLIVFVLNLLLFNLLFNLDRVFKESTIVCLSFLITGFVMVSAVLIIRRRYKINEKITQVNAFNVLLVLIPLLVLLPVAIMFDDLIRESRSEYSGNGVEYLEQNFDKIIQESDGTLDSINLKIALDHLKKPEYNDWIGIIANKNEYAIRLPLKGYIKDSGIVNIKNLKCKYESYTLKTETYTDSNEMYDIWVIDFDQKKSGLSTKVVMEECFRVIKKFQGKDHKYSEEFTYEDCPALKLEIKDEKTRKTHRVNMVFSETRLYILEVLTENSMYPNRHINLFMNGLYTHGY